MYPLQSLRKLSSLQTRTVMATSLKENLTIFPKKASRGFAKIENLLVARLQTFLLNFKSSASVRIQESHHNLIIFKLSDKAMIIPFSTYSI
jgi:hypothetical protein